MKIIRFHYYSPNIVSSESCLGCYGTNWSGTCDYILCLVILHAELAVPHATEGVPQSHHRCQGTDKDEAQVEVQLLLCQTPGQNEVIMKGLFTNQSLTMAVVIQH